MAKKLCVLLFGITMGIFLSFSVRAVAKVVTVPDTLSYVDYAVGSANYPSVGKMYDSNANVVCYTLYMHYDMEANAISCVALK